MKPAFSTLFSKEDLGKIAELVLIDNYDSFTHNLLHLLQICEPSLVCDVISNDDPRLQSPFFALPKAIVFSPGPGHPCESGWSPQVMKRYLGKVPILGICLGHQLLATVCGGTVLPSTPVHGYTSSIDHYGRGLFAGLPARFEVMRYHSLIVDSVSERTLQIDALTDCGKIMAISQPALCAYGLQFHPEAYLSQYGKELIHNFFTLAAQFRSTARIY